MKYYFNLIFLVIFGALVNGYPDPGKWNLTLDLNSTVVLVPKSLFKGSQVFIQITCHSDPVTNVTVSWSLSESMCYEEHVDLRAPLKPDYYLKINDNRTFTKYVKPSEYVCAGAIRLPSLTNKGGKDPPASDTNSVSESPLGVDSDTEHLVKVKTHPKESEHHPVTNITNDGFYMVMLMIKSEQNIDFYAHVEIEMMGQHGYLSASDWPLLPFYGIMCLLYIFLGIMWLIASFCRWQDLLRIQFWIGGVIFLGMLEKAMFYAEFANANKTGNSTTSLVLAAEWVSCGKRTLARMLVIIVNLGFGIVKPRLGPMLHRVVGVGACYFVLACVESYIRVMPPTAETANNLLIASIPLAALDSIICWWILTALVQTTRTLRLRRNMVKLSLYRHFTNTLIFNVLASIIFMLYTIKVHRLATCLTDWKELWVDDAFWHVLFSIILIVIMVLWRPTNNNQRYAFTPLLDNADDDDEDEHFVNDAYGVKMRTHSRAGSPKLRNKNEDEEDILRWAEDNIPSAGIEALPILDSEEEVETTKTEQSKML